MTRSIRFIPRASSLMILLFASLNIVQAGTDLPLTQWIVAAPDRSEADRAKDARRAPAELLAFSGVKAGDKVAEIGAGDGYTTELLARLVSCSGTVYAQNTPYIINNYVKDGFDKRLEKAVMNPVQQVIQEFDNPLPAAARDLDAVFMVLIYHDALVAKADETKMNKAIFDALRPGGHFIVVDHHAKQGSGKEAVGTIHRIDADYVKKQVEAVGFKLVEEGDFLSNPDDPREQHFRKMETDTDKFVFKFQKPAL